MEIDYSLYLVTDSTEAILQGRDLVTIVREAIEGGVTIVQYRDKTSDTADLIRTAKQLHSVTKEHGIPLLINDRVDVALAVGAEGVHIGQDDMDIARARKLLGPGAIIGVTASSVKEALLAAEGGADYLGLGTVFATPTKSNTKSIVGHSGVRDMLSALSAPDHGSVKTVCIGGINESNVQRVIYQSATPSKALDGVAVVSAIVGASDPRSAAARIRTLVGEPPLFARTPQPESSAYELLHAKRTIPDITRKLAETKPLCHNMTNLVVQNMAANVALCVGASPIMSNNGLEAADLAKLGGALVVNMGTVTPDMLSNYTQALAAYNAAGRPCVFDPVGAGATTQRRDAVRHLMAAGYFDVIKGNEGEILALAGPGAAGAALAQPPQQQRGVDSSSTLTLAQKSALVSALARQERNVVVMTGAVDVLSDGRRTLAVSNGHPLLAAVTGTGCCLGAAIAAYLAVHTRDKLLATLAALLHYEIAAERVDGARGPGTFLPLFLDELHRITETAGKKDEDERHGWLARAKVEVLQ